MSVEKLSIVDAFSSVQPATPYKFAKLKEKTCHVCQVPITLSSVFFRALAKLGSLNLGPEKTVGIVVPLPSNVQNIFGKVLARVGLILK